MQKYIPLNTAIFNIYDWLQPQNDSCFSEATSAELEEFEKKNPEPDPELYKFVNSKQEMVQDQMTGQ